MRYKPLLFLTLIVICTSCHRTVLLDFDKQPVMELYGNVLYYDEIENGMPSGLSSDDSLNFVEDYKRKWATDILLYDKALNNIGYTDEIQVLTESYRKELMISEYQRKMASQNMKPLSEDSVYAFYSEHKDEFPLSEAVVKGLFIKVLTTAPDQAKLSKWLTDINDSNLDDIMRYCTKNASYQQLFLDNWVPYSSISGLMSQQIEPNDPALTRGTVVQQTDDYTYYLKITGLCGVGTSKPYELVYQDIRNILENKNKIEYIHSFHNSLYERAVERGTIKFYDE
ncbi:MAG: hypothetical protein MJ010_08955 [Paludibacteraceae bacterium]|nr:hypothetical protein [Paludibacteraceae bacterium]